MARVIHREELHNAFPDTGTSYQFEGEDVGDVPVSFFWTDAPVGVGPRLHQHPYPEVFVVQDGKVAFTVDGETLETSGGEIVIAPPDRPHRFVHHGPGPAHHVDIHPRGRVNGARVGALMDLAAPVAPFVIRRLDLPRGETSARFEGQTYGVPVSFFWTDAAAGTGPALHRHPYAEVFVVQEGNVTFSVGGETIAARGGQIVVVPAGLPHRFVNAGPGRSRHLDIHPTGRMVTEWLEG